MSRELYYGRGLDSYSSRAPFYSGGVQSVLPDVRFHVPMESRRDIEKVKDALDMEGVRSVHCDLASQIVTVSGNVPFHRLLKKLKHVKRRSKLLSFASPDSRFNSSYGHELYDPSYSSSFARPMRGYSPPREHSSSYIAHSYERPYYEDYEDYRPYRYGY